MDGKERRQKLITLMEESDGPISGEKLAGLLGVSRQVIVQDIALLRAADMEILATNRGYLCKTAKKVSRVFYVKHKPEEIEAEINSVVDFGGTVVDGFVEHEPYGELRAPLGIHTRHQVRSFVNSIENGNSSPLSTITSGEHYHTVEAESEEILDEIEQELKKQGFLMK